jgi:hypothetical protein
MDRPFVPTRVVMTDTGLEADPVAYSEELVATSTRR